MTNQDADTPELQAIAELARHRQRRRGMAVIVCSTAVAALGGLLGFTLAHRNHHPHHHASTVVAMTVLVVAVVLLITEGVVIYLMASRKGFLAPPLIFGLPYRDRRVVMRALRRGEPPHDATLRAVGVKTAERAIRYGNLAMVLYVVLALADATNFLIPGRPVGFKILMAVAAVVLLAAPFYQRAYIRGARRYLQQVAGPDSVPPN